MGTDTGLFTNRLAQDKFVADWGRMARRYRDSRVLRDWYGKNLKAK